METGLPLVPFPMVPAYPANMSMASYPPYQTSFPPTTSVTFWFQSANELRPWYFQFAHMPSVALPGNMADFAAQVSNDIIFIHLLLSIHITPLKQAFIITKVRQGEREKNLSMQIYLLHNQAYQGGRHYGVPKSWTKLFVVPLLITLSKNNG